MLLLSTFLWPVQLSYVTQKQLEGHISRVQYVSNTDTAWIHVHGVCNNIAFFSQASWGRLEMKPKRNKGHGSGKLIASLQTLLSKATSLEIFQSLRSLLTYSSQVSLGLPLPLPFEIIRQAIS